MNAPFEQAIAEAQEQPTRTERLLETDDIERALLGSLIADNKQIDWAADRLDVGDFTNKLFARIFARMAAEAALGNSVNWVTLAPHFRDDDEFQKAGGEKLLEDAYRWGPDDASPRTYVEQIASLAQRRKLAKGLRDIAQAATDLTVSNEQLLADADGTIAAVADKALEDGYLPAGEFGRQVIADFGKPVVGIRCGLISSLDDLLGPLRPASNTVLAGRPGMGKTAVASSYMLGATALGHGILFISLEMRGRELAARQLADLCFTRDGAVPFSRIRDGEVSGSDLRRVLEAQQRLEQLPLEIADRGSMKLSQIHRLVRQWKRRQHAKGLSADGVIIDYLGLIVPERPGMGIYEHTTETSKGIKNMAKAEDLAVVTLVQLSREVEKRTDKRPIPSDLRDSGGIEQDADAIVFLYREEEYLSRAEPRDQYSPEYLKWRDEMDAVRDRIEFICEKRRNGGKAKAAGYFLGRFQAVRGGDFYGQGGQQQ